MKKVLILLVAISIALCGLFVGCGEKKILHCDHCGGEIEVPADNQMEEDWIIYCESCNEELFGDDPVVNPG